jgi:nucleoside-diphosphate-sugar epimerase
VTFLLLGCGYTARRVALRLAEGGHHVIATTRQPERLAALARLGVSILPLELTDQTSLAHLREAIPPGLRVLYSAPLLRAGSSWLDPTPDLVSTLRGRATRVVYLSSTGVYGATPQVDESTPPAPRTLREELRLKAERSLTGGPWQSMVLRPAAIYGPGRGVHASIREGKYFLIGDGLNYISRIHVDDLAAHAHAALLTDVEGAWPVADEEPCQAREIAAFCASLLNLPMPASIDNPPSDDTRRANRRVDGSAIRRRLGVALRYPSYRSGIPACLEQEAAGVR